MTSSCNVSFVLTTQCMAQAATRGEAIPKYTTLQYSSVAKLFTLLRKCLTSSSLLLTARLYYYYYVLIRSNSICYNNMTITISLTNMNFK